MNSFLEKALTGGLENGKKKLSRKPRWKENTATTYLREGKFQLKNPPLPVTEKMPFVNTERAQTFNDRSLQGILLKLEKRPL